MSLPLSLSLCVCVCVCVYPSVRPSICLSVCLSVFLFVVMSCFFLSLMVWYVCLFVCWLLVCWLCGWLTGWLIICMIRVHSIGRKSAMLVKMIIYIKQADLWYITFLTIQSADCTDLLRSVTPINLLYRSTGLQSRILAVTGYWRRPCLIWPPYHYAVRAMSTRWDYFPSRMTQFTRWEFDKQYNVTMG